MRILLIVISMLLVLSCNNPKRANPFDTGGENWYPPMVVAMADTVVSIYDTMIIHAQGTDSNGTVSKYFWALDGVNYADSTDSGRVKCVFTTAGVKTVLVKVRDNDGVYSLKSDSAVITAHLYAPVVVAMNDTTVAINDSFFVHATGTDTNGTIQKYLWAVDGVNYNDSTDSGRVKTAFGSFGTKVIRVKVRDDDGIVSAADSVAVTVKGNAPVNLSPADSATILVVLPNLSWIPGMYHSSFRVLLDTVNPPVEIAGTGITDSQYTPAASLKIGMAYYWRVIGINGSSAEAPGPVWLFTTENPPGGMKLITSSGKSFQMGSTNGFSDELPVHSVTVSAFYMDTNEVTQADYDSLLGVNPSHFTGDSLRPVENMTWFDAVLYCNVRSKRDGKDTVYTFTSITGTPGNGCSDLVGLAIDFTKNGYRLPTEAEWEYACRAGTTTDYYWGGSYPPITTADTAATDNNAVWQHNSNNSTARVGTKLPNAYGLFDMSGNVWEWCNDWYGSYSSGSQTDPTGPNTGSYRVLRGGSWYDNVNLQRSALHGKYLPDDENICVGFRCICR
jgi:sulfatase modifying factor 1